MASVNSIRRCVGGWAVTILLQSMMWLWPLPATVAEEDRIRVRARQIHTAAGEVIAPGEVLIVDGKISFVGSAIELALPAREVEVDTLIPGIVNVSSNAGLEGGRAEVSREITPDFDTLSAIDWRSREFLEARDSGITTIQVLPSTENVFCGYACVVKTAGAPEERVVAPERAVVMAVCSDPTQRNRSRTRPDSIYVRQPTNRMGVVWIVRNSLHQAEQGQVTNRLDASTIQILKGLLGGQTEAISVSRTDFDIRSALGLGEEYGFLPVIYGGDEVYRILDQFAASGAKLAYTALTTNADPQSLRGNEGTELRWNVPGMLERAGVEFCLAGENLLDQARFAVRFGLAPELALQAITRRPARFLNLEDRIGSIQVGKHADLVALTGDPLQATSAIQWTMVDGTIYDSDENPE